MMLPELQHCRNTKIHLTCWYYVTWAAPRGCEGMALGVRLCWINALMQVLICPLPLPLSFVFNCFVQPFYFSALGSASQSNGPSAEGRVVTEQSFMTQVHPAHKHTWRGPWLTWMGGVLRCFSFDCGCWPLYNVKPSTALPVSWTYNLGNIRKKRPSGRIGVYGQVQNECAVVWYSRNIYFLAHLLPGRLNFARVSVPVWPDHLSPQSCHVGTQISIKSLRQRGRGWAGQEPCRKLYNGEANTHIIPTWA